MKTRYSKPKLIAAAITLLFLLSLIGTGVFYNSNLSLKDGLNETKLKAEKLLSEKLSLQKELEKFKKDVASLTGKNKSLDKMLAELKQKLNNADVELAKVKKDNALTDSLKKQLAELKEMKEALDKEVARLKLNTSELSAHNTNLSETIVSLEDENKVLTDNAEMIKMMAGDEFMVESLRGKKDKLTVNAKKTRKMMVGFVLPEDISTTIHFRIVTPSGKAIDSREESAGISSTVIGDDSNFTASLSPLSGEMQVSKRVQMVYQPKEKMTGGIYKIQLFNEDNYVGTLQVRLN